MKRILSFDCANKTLAACGVVYNPSGYSDFLNRIPGLIELTLSQIIDIKQEFNASSDANNSQSITPEVARDRILQKLKFVNEQVISAICAFYNIWKIEYTICRDILPGKKVKGTTPVERCVALKQTIAEIHHNFTPDLVFIEDQMPTNEKARGVMYCLMYEYGDKAIQISPTKKNMISLGGSSYCDFIARYSTSYTANKMHIVDNFKKVRELLELQSTCIYKNANTIISATSEATTRANAIPNAHISHIGDAFFQIVAVTITDLVCDYTSTTKLPYPK